MTKRVVSKRTKLLFIAFGAASIAMVCIVTAAEMDGADANTSKPNAIVHPAVPPQPGH